MTVKQALKRKNVLAKEIKEAFVIAQTHNSIDAGNVRRYSTLSKLEEAEALTKELVGLKAKIHRANASVYDKIFLLSELKSSITQIRGINVDEGKVVTGGYSSVTREMSAEINANDKDALVKKIEKQIDELQDELDIHNATTQI